MGAQRGRLTRFLLVDIGNTRVKWATADVSEDGPDRTLGGVRAVVHGDLAGADDPAGLDQLFDAVVCSNVASPDVERAVRERFARGRMDIAWTSVVPTHEAGGVINAYREPAQLGPDRWAALLGAHALHPDEHVLVCGFGTATTIDLLVRDEATAGARARFVGGAILPGFDLMRRALARDTARLPNIADGTIARAGPFASSTDEAIAGGIVAAQAGAVERSWREALRRSTISGTAVRTRCVLAGGGAHAVAPHLALEDVDGPARIEVVPELVLRGLAVLAESAAVALR